MELHLHSFQSRGRLHARFGWHPAHLTLISNVDVLSPQLQHAARRVRNNVLTLVQANLQFDHVRAPLDIRRYDVSMAPWHTFDIIGDNVSSHDGLMRSWKRAINELQWHTQACQTFDMALPMLSDVDIYGRSMKTMYVVGLQHIKFDWVWQNTLCYLECDQKVCTEGVQCIPTTLEGP